MAGLTSLRRAARNAIDAGKVMLNLGRFYLRGEMPEIARYTVLNLHCRTNGKSTAMITPIVRAARPPRPRAAASGVLGDLSIEKQNQIADSIAKNGFHIFETPLPEEMCDRIAAYAAKTPASIENSKDLVVFDPQRPVSKTYRLLEPDIVREPAMQDFMTDRSILAVAETYLKTLPVLSGVNLWFSPAYGNAPGEAAAQEFHFDFDPPPIWLLFFVYLTDVGPDSGPHVFVRGTHVPGKDGMAELLARGYVRIPDEDVVKNFGPDSIVELCGRRGTILAVDTRGLHKGKMPVIGHRLMAQLSFTTPPFSRSHGSEVPVNGSITASFARALEALPAVYTWRYKRKSEA